MNNPLMKTFDGPFGTIPFNDIKTEHFVPAITKGIEDAESAIKSITDTKSKPTFENTILALELSGQKLGSAINTYYHLFGSESDQKFKDLSDKISPMVAEFENNIYLNESLFKRIEKVFDNKHLLEDEEDIRLINITYNDFVRNGAALSEADKINLRDIDKKLSTLSPQFSKNTLNATNEFELWLDKTDLDGLPDTVVEAAKLAAKEKGELDKWLITGHFPSFSPFMQYSTRRELRKKVHIATSSKCNGGKYDNNTFCKEIADLKHKRAKILGYDNYADYILQERMAEKQENIYKLLDNLYDSCIEHAKNDLMQISDLAKTLDNIDEICESAWGIMVARGDLGIETSLTDLPNIQRKIMNSCAKLGKRSIVATHLLESMIENPTPTRAEVTDVANAVYEGADAIMLSGETSIGKYPVECVKFLKSISKRTEKFKTLEYEKELITNSDWESIAVAARDLSESINADGIIAVTRTGSTAGYISNAKPKDIPIYTFTNNLNTLNQLSLVGSVIPFYLKRLNNHKKTRESLLKNLP